MKTPGPIFVTELFPKLNAELQELLCSLEDEDWKRPATGVWSVKDVVAHLLDTTLRRLAVDRDQYVSLDTPKLQTDRDPTNYINQTNAEWVKAARRLSPRLLIELLEKVGQEMYEFFKTLDPYKTAIFPVSWAGEQVSPNWFDIAREYTEKWHHQEQIREAVHRLGLTSREYLFPVLDTFMRALPHVYRNVRAVEETLIKTEITGPAGGDWFLIRKQDRWELWLGVEEKPKATVRMPQDVAWKLFTKGLEKSSAERRMSFKGTKELGRQILDMICIIG
ncbi:MAG: hypothetical protein DMG72_12535 [Acidobacteria bacterium]|nr:MAG: hypothetical protein DMG72_12535 [Acidobacteriota bacterium]